MHASKSSWKHCPTGGQLALDGGDEVVAEHGGQRRRRRLVAAARPGRDLGPLALGRFASQVPQAMDEATLAEGARKTRLDGADEAGRAVR
jgi:hypothetical protein